MKYLVDNTKDTSLMTKISEIKKLVDRYRFKDAKALVEELINIIKE